MCALLAFICMLWGLAVQAQTYQDSMAVAPQDRYVDFKNTAIDSLRNEVFDLRNEVTRQRNNVSSMQLNLFRFHQKYKTGTLLLAAGLATFVVANVRLANQQTASLNDAYLWLGGFGGMVAGQVIMISSHKFIGKAGVPYRRFGQEE